MAGDERFATDDDFSREHVLDVSLFDSFQSETPDESPVWRQQRNWESSWLGTHEGFLNLTHILDMFNFEE